MNRRPAAAALTMLFAAAWCATLSAQLNRAAHRGYRPRPFESIALSREPAGFRGASANRGPASAPDDSDAASALVVGKKLSIPVLNPRSVRMPAPVTEPARIAGIPAPAGPAAAPVAPVTVAPTSPEVGAVLKDMEPYMNDFAKLEALREIQAAGTAAPTTTAFNLSQLRNELVAEAAGTATAADTRAYFGEILRGPGKDATLPKTSKLPKNLASEINGLLEDKAVVNQLVGSSPELIQDFVPQIRKTRWFSNWFKKIRGITDNQLERKLYRDYLEEQLAKTVPPRVPAQFIHDAAATGRPAIVEVVVDLQKKYKNVNLLGHLDANRHLLTTPEQLAELDKIKPKEWVRFRNSIVPPGAAAPSRAPRFQLPMPSTLNTKSSCYLGRFYTWAGGVPRP